MAPRSHTQSADDRLGQIPLFQACSKKDLRTLARITTEVAVRAGTVLCREGERGQQFFVVVDGEATVDIGGDFIDTIGTNGFFGEMALLDGGPRVATVTAKTDMVVLAMSRSEFVSLLAMTNISTSMLASLAARLRHTDEMLRPGGIGI